MVALPEGFPLAVCEPVMGPYPRGNPEGLRAGGDAWAGAARKCRAEADRLDRVALSVPGCFTGAAGDGAQRVLAESAARKRDLTAYCEGKAAECYETANVIELGQVTWIVMGSALVVELLATLAMPAGGVAAAAGVRVAARKGWQLVWVRLIESVIAVCARLSASRALLIGQGIVVGGVFGGGVSWGAQVWQQQRGDREVIDWETVVVSGAGGAAGGLGAGVLYSRPVAGLLGRLHGSGTRRGNVAGLLVAGGAAGVAGGVTGTLGGAVAASVYAGGFTMPEGAEFYLGALNGALEGLLSGGVHTVGNSAPVPTSPAGPLGRSGRPRPGLGDLEALVRTMTEAGPASVPAAGHPMPTAPSVDTDGTAPLVRVVGDDNTSAATPFPAVSNSTATVAAISFPLSSSDRTNTGVPRTVADPAITVGDAGAGTSTTTRLDALPGQNTRVSLVGHPEIATRYPVAPGEASVTTALPASTGPSTPPPAVDADPTTSAHTTGGTAPSADSAGIPVDAYISDPPAHSPVSAGAAGADGRAGRQTNTPWTSIAEYSTSPEPPSVHDNSSTRHPQTRSPGSGNPAPVPAYSASATRGPSLPAAATPIGRPMMTGRGVTAITTPPTSATPWRTPRSGVGVVPPSGIGNSADGDHMIPTPVRPTTTTTGLEPGTRVTAGPEPGADGGAGAGNRGSDYGGIDGGNNNGDNKNNENDNGDNNNETTFGDWFRALRKSHNMTQLEFAERLGVAMSSISRWESDKNKPLLEQLRTLIDKGLVPESTLQSTYRKFYSDPGKFPDGLPPLVPQVHDPTVYPTLGAWLADIRQSNTMYQTELAELLGVDESSIYSWETGRHRPPLEYLRRFLDRDVVDNEALEAAYQHFYRDPGNFPEGLPLLVPRLDEPRRYPSMGSWLADIRRYRGMSQTEFGELLGANQIQSGRWETGSAKPSLEQLRILIDEGLVPESVLQSVYQKYYIDPADFPGGIPPLMRQVDNPAVYPSFGAWLADVRRQNSMKPPELAELLGLTRASILNWESGVYKPPMEQLRKLLDEGLVSESALRSAYEHFYIDPAEFPDGPPPLLPFRIHDPAVYPYFGAWLADIRRHSKMTRSEFAELLGLTRASILNWESGVYKPPLVQLRKLLDEGLVSESALRSAYEHFYIDPADLPGGLPPLVVQIDNPAVYPSLGAWLADIRKQQNMYQTEFAELVGFGKDSIQEWETDQRYPVLRNLRTIRDATGTSADALRAAIEHFYRDRSAHRDPPDIEEKFWELIATAPDSVDERRLQLEIVEHYPYTGYSGESRTLKEFVDRSIPRRTDAGRRDDVAQRVYLGIWRAVATHNPMLGSFDRHASATARGRVLASYFEDRYPDLDSPTLHDVVKVKGYLDRQLEIPGGGTPGVPEIAAELRMKPDRAREALRILQQKPGIAVNAAPREGSRGFQLADPTDDMADATLRLTVREALTAEFDGSDLVSAEEVVMRHFTYGWPLAEAIADLDLEPAAAQDIIDRARPALRAALSEPGETR